MTGDRSRSDSGVRALRPAGAFPRYPCGIDPAGIAGKGREQPVRAGPDGPAGGVVRIRLDLAYDGTAFSGWARQPGRRTVQQIVEDALATVLRLSHPVALTVAGRTDAGVHAIGQVAHVDLPVAVPEGLQARLNRRLDDDVRVTGLRPVSDDFDARFSALARVYRYRLTDGVPDPLRRHDTIAWRRPLDVNAMHDAAQALLGEHDFAAYCRRREGATTRRTLRRLDVVRREDDVVATIEADAFCHNMVRGLIGALLAVGDGRRPTRWPADVLTREVRDPAVTVAPAHGLTLVEVRYPPDDELAARAALTRARRDT